MPRLLLKSGRNLTASVPWAAPRGRFTLSFEAHVIALLQHCRTVPGAALMAGITEDPVDGVMRRAVARGMTRRELEHGRPGALRLPRGCGNGRCSISYSPK